MKIVLEGIKPEIWRKFLVEDSISFHELHKIIQAAMGWYDCHMYEFKVDDTFIEGDEELQGFCIDTMWKQLQPKKGKSVSAGKTKLSKFIKKENLEFSYTYDLGDNWQHSIIVEKIIEDAKQETPFCIGGKRACPPEDCGSVHGYEELMRIRKDKSHPEYKERIVEWLGEDFDPEFFDVEEINDELSSIDDYDEVEDILGEYKELGAVEKCVSEGMIRINKAVKSGSTDKKMFEEAVECFDKALKIDSDCFDANIGKAQMLHWLGDKSHEKYIDKCYGIDNKRTKNFMKNYWIEEIPGVHPLAILSSSLIQINDYMSKSEFKKAVEAIDKVIDMEMEQKMKEVVYSMKIECLMCLKDYEKAEENIRKLIELNKEYPKPYFHRAVIAYNKKNYEESLKETDKCISFAEKTNMKHPQYYQLKADIMKKLDKEGYEEFEEIAKKVEKESMQMIKSMSKKLGMKQKDIRGLK